MYGLFSFSFLSGVRMVGNKRNGKGGKEGETWLLASGFFCSLVDCLGVMIHISIPTFLYPSAIIRVRPWPDDLEEERGVFLRE